MTFLSKKNEINDSSFCEQRLVFQENASRDSDPEHLEPSLDVGGEFNGLELNLEMLETKKLTAAEFYKGLRKLFSGLGLEISKLEIKDQDEVADFIKDNQIDYVIKLYNSGWFGEGINAVGEIAAFLSETKKYGVKGVEIINRFLDEKLPRDVLNENAISLIIGHDGLVDVVVEVAQKLGSHLSHSLCFRSSTYPEYLYLKNLSASDRDVLLRNYGKILSYSKNLDRFSGIRLIHTAILEYGENFSDDMVAYLSSNSIPFDRNRAKEVLDRRFKRVPDSSRGVFLSFETQEDIGQFSKPRMEPFDGEKSLDYLEFLKLSEKEKKNFFDFAKFVSDELLVPFRFGFARNISYVAKKSDAERKKLKEVLLKVFNNTVFGLGAMHEDIFRILMTHEKIDFYLKFPINKIEDFEQFCQKALGIGMGGKLVNQLFYLDKILEVISDGLGDEYLRLLTLDSSIHPASIKTAFGTLDQKDREKLMGLVSKYGRGFLNIKSCFYFFSKVVNEGDDSLENLACRFIEKAISNDERMEELMMVLNRFGDKGFIDAAPVISNILENTSGKKLEFQLTFVWFRMEEGRSLDDIKPSLKSSSEALDDFLTNKITILELGERLGYKNLRKFNFDSFVGEYCSFVTGLSYLREFLGLYGLARDANLEGPLANLIDLTEFQKFVSENTLDVVIDTVKKIERSNYARRMNFSSLNDRLYKLIPFPRDAVNYIKQQITALDDSGVSIVRVNNENISELAKNIKIIKAFQHDMSKESEFYLLNVFANATEKYGFDRLHYGVSNRLAVDLDVNNLDFADPDVVLAFDALPGKVSFYKKVEDVREKYNFEAAHKAGHIKFDPEILAQNVVSKGVSKYSPRMFEVMRSKVQDLFGGGRADRFVMDVLSGFYKNLKFDYADLVDNINLAIKFKNPDGFGSMSYEFGKDRKKIYGLFGGFILSKIVGYLNEQLGPKQSNLAVVEKKLIENGTSVEEVVKKLNENGVNFEIRLSDLEKGIKNLKEGNLKYLFSKAVNKGMKVTKDVGDKDKNLETGENIAFHISKSRLGTMPEVSVDDVVRDYGENIRGYEVGKMFVISSGKVFAQVLTGGVDGQNNLFRGGDAKYLNHENLVIVSSAAFSTGTGELSDFAAKDGEIISYLLSPSGKDGMIVVNDKSQIKIFDKRNINLKEFAEFVGFGGVVDDKKLELLDDFDDFVKFSEVVRDSHASLLSTMMLIKDGKVEQFNDNYISGLRLLVEFEDGAFGMFDSGANQQLLDIVKIMQSYPKKVKNVVYLDTGSFDYCKYYAPVESPDGMKLVPMHLGQFDNDDKNLSNILALSVTSEKIWAHVEVPKPRIIARAEWGANDPKVEDFTKYPDDLSKVLTHIVVHHSAGDGEVGDGTPQSIQKMHMKKGDSDIAYHFVIDAAGNIYEGRDVGVMGAHAGQTVEANEEAAKVRSGEVSENIDEARKKDPDYGSIGIVLAGNFDGSGNDSKGATDAQKDSLGKLLAYLKQKYNVPTSNIIPHKYVKTDIVEKRGLTFTGQETVCPGKNGIFDLKDVKLKLPEDTLESAKKKL